MPGLIIWHLGLVLQGFILYRGFRGRLLSRYPLFYLYISSSLLGNGMMSVVFFTHRESYAAWYWPTQYVTMLVGSGVILEMLRCIPLSHRDVRGLARITRYVLLAVVVCFLAACLLTPGVLRVVAIDVVLERDFRLAQALILLLIAGIVLRDELPIGRNVKGIFLGYGLYVGASLVTLCRRSLCRIALRCGLGLRSTLFLYGVARDLAFCPLEIPPRPCPPDGIRSAVDKDRLFQGAGTRKGCDTPFQILKVAYS